MMMKKKSRKTTLKRREGGVPSRLAGLTREGLMHLLRCLYEHHHLKPKPRAPREEDRSIDLNFFYKELD